MWSDEQIYTYIFKEFPPIFKFPFSPSCAIMNSTSLVLFEFWCIFQNTNCWILFGLWKKNNSFHKSENIAKRNFEHMWLSSLIITVTFFKINSFLNHLWCVKNCASWVENDYNKFYIYFLLLSKNTLWAIFISFLWTRQTFVDTYL